VACAATALACEPSPPPLRDVGVARPHPAEPARSPEAASPTASSRASADAGPPVLAAPGPLVALDVEGWAPAVVSLPLGATSPRPVVLATHGNYDRPEWQCEVWRGIIGNRAFILCPRGISRPDSPSADDVRFTYVNNKELEKEIDAGLSALGARYAAWIDRGPILYTGFSLGAIMGVAIGSRGTGPERYPRMVLVEGGHDKWSAANVKAFTAPGGARRILFACGQPGCAQVARRAATQLEKAGVAARVVHGEGVGHSYDGPVAAQVKASLEWVIEGDARWQ
jgi:hypothetical protein